MHITERNFVRLRCSVANSTMSNAVYTMHG